MSTVEELEDLKEKVKKLQRNADRATGALEQSKNRLKDEFELDSLEEGEIALEKLRAKEEKAKKAFSSAMEKFEEEWDGKLN